MAFSAFGKGSWLLAICLVLVLLPGKAHAFGAGNIPSVSLPDSVVTTRPYF
jgi:heterokaryon incompatibility protein Het-C